LDERGCVVDKKGDNQPTIERWTARRKADLVLEIIKSQKTIVDAAREYDLKQSEIQKWMETFLEYGRQGLRANPRNAESAYEEELKAHREKIGELVLQIDVLKKAKKVLEDSEEENSSSE
jgi:transposase-like protein